MCVCACLYVKMYIIVRLRFFVFVSTSLEACWLSIGEVSLKQSREKAMNVNFGIMYTERNTKARKSKNFWNQVIEFILKKNSEDDKLWEETNERKRCRRWRKHLGNREVWDNRQGREKQTNYVFIFTSISICFKTSYLCGYWLYSNLVRHCYC